MLARMRFFLIGTAVFGLCLYGPQVCLAQKLRSDTVEQTSTVWLQYEGTHGIREHIVGIIDRLTKGEPWDYTESLLYSLSLFGDEKTLPSFDHVIQAFPDPDVVAFAKVARARLVAENAASSISDPKLKASTKVARFYQELGLTPASLNAAISTYVAQINANRSASPPVTDQGPVAQPFGLVAAFQLADIVYQSFDYASYADLPGIKDVNFASYGPLALKIRMAPLTREQRVAALIKALPGTEEMHPYISQLIADEGPLGRLAVLAKCPPSGLIPGKYYDVLELTGGTNPKGPTHSLRQAILCY